MDSANKGGAQLDRLIIPANFDWAAWNMEPEYAKIVTPSSMTDDTVATFYGDEEAGGAYYPWDKVSERGVRIATHEVTVHTGLSSSWKSMATSQIANHLCRQGERVLIASFEMRAKKTMHRMCRQAAGTDQPSVKYIRDYLDWLEGKLYLYDHFGMCKPQQILAVVRYAAEELKVTHILIDSLSKVIDGTDDYTGQKSFVNQLCAAALKYGIHIHLIAHRKKPQQGSKSGMYEVSGTADIVNQVDNVVVYDRKVQEEDDGQALAQVQDADHPDLVIEWAKQRNSEWTGKKPFWFNKRSLCVVEKPGGTWPMIHLEEMKW